MVKTFLTTFIIFAVAPQARALPTFPEELRRATDAPCLPHCNVCHRDDNAGSGTVDRPFARSMRQIGALDGDLKSVDRAIAKLGAAGTDSDGDGVSDVDELSQGDDPNTSYAASTCGPQVGCSAAAGAGGQTVGIAALLVVSCLLLMRRPRSRRR